MYKLKNVVMMGHENGLLRPNTIYAELYDENDKLVIGATLEYVLCCIRDRKYEVEGITVGTQKTSLGESSIVNLTKY